MDGSSASSSSSGPTSRVSYKKYDPTVRNKRISQLSVGSSSDGSGGGSTTAAPPTRILGSSARPQGQSVGSFGSPSSARGSDHAAMDGSAGMANNDYFASMHSESTAQSMSLRQRDRDPATHRHPGPGSTSGSSNASSTVNTPNSVSGPAIYNAAGPPSLLSVNSSSSMASYSGASATSDVSYTPGSSAASTIQPEQKTPNSVMIPLPRSQSAMASLQGPSPGRSSPSSQQQQQYRAFIPPSAYVASSSSTASSPGPSNLIPISSPGKMVPNVANHISSAFARGLHGVNGVVNGSTSVRLPQSASNVANAVWNRLPAGVQQLKHDLVWDGLPTQSSPESRDQYIAGMGGFGNMRQQAGGQNDDYAFGPTITSASPPPQGTRSLSMGAVVLGSERERDMRPGSSASAASYNSGRATPSSPGNAASSYLSTLDASHPSAVPIAAQLRLDYANQQLQHSPGRHPELGGMRSNSAIHMSAAPTPKAKAPYKAGYQPKGALRNRTEEFMSMRNGKTGAGRRASKELDGSGISLHSLEDERLLRRLDKIIELHFPSSAATAVAGTERAGMPRSTSTNSLASDSSVLGSPQRIASGMRRTSDMFGRAMKGVSRMTGGGDTRSGDQLIVKWQEDSEVTRCPICHAPFNVITRKHHCRLCGRVVCFLPPNISPPQSNKQAKDPTERSSDTPTPLLPTRSQRCSTFVIYEYLSPVQTDTLGVDNPALSEKHARTPSLLSSGLLREVDLGDSGAPVNPSLSARERDILETQIETKRAEEMKKGVRVCRECLDVVMKRQKKVQPKRVEGWMRLYGLLTDLQADIENALPTLSELRSATPTTAAIVNQFNKSRKLLLQNLSSYDILAKRIRDLAPDPTTPTTTPASRLIGPNNQPISSSQDRLQKAIYNRAMLFLGEKMALMKGMGGLAVDLPPPPPAVVQSSNGDGANGQSAKGQRRQSMRSKKEEEERMARLAVLYEQEALVSGYLDDANARRQFEDAAALKNSLDDLREEIQALLS